MPKNAWVLRWMSRISLANLYVTGTVGNIALAALWAWYSLRITISAPFVAHRILDHEIPEVPSGSSFTRTDVHNAFTVYGRCAIAVNIFGWFMFSFAIINVVLLILKTVSVQIEVRLGQEINLLAAEPWNLVWIIPHKIVAYATPPALAAVSVAQCAVACGLAISALGCRAYALWTFAMTDEMCATGGGAWNTTTLDCGVPDYQASTEIKWSNEATCCDGGQSICCAIDAPFDYGLATSSAWHSPQPFTNSQKQIRASNLMREPNRIQYMLMTSYTNPFDVLWKQKIQAQDFALAELWMVVISVLFACATVHSIVLAFTDEVKMVSGGVNPAPRAPPAPPAPPMNRDGDIETRGGIRSMRSVRFSSRRR